MPTPHGICQVICVFIVSRRGECGGGVARIYLISQGNEADQVTTSYENGVLTIAAPYSEVSRTRRISVTAKKDAEQAEPEAAGAR